MLSPSPLVAALTLQAEAPAFVVLPGPRGITKHREGHLDILSFIQVLSLHVRRSALCQTLLQGAWKIIPNETTQTLCSRGVEIPGEEIVHRHGSKGSTLGL